MSRPGLALATLLLLAGLVVSRPLALEWRDGLPLTARAPEDRAVLLRATGDTLQLYYQLWLVRDGLLGPTPLFRDPYQFRIDGPRWNLPQSFPPLALPFVLLSPLGLHAAYNMLVLLSFPLSGLSAYLLIRHYTGDRLAAAAGGVAFALAPARLSPLFGGQPAGFAAALAPLVFWGLDLGLTHARRWGGLAGGGALFAVATLEPHYAYLLGGLVPIYALARWGLAPPPRRISWASIVAFVTLAGAGAGWLLLFRQAFLSGSIAAAGRSLDEVRLFSPGPAALLASDTYGGLLVLALTLIGLARSGDGVGWRPIRVFYGAVFVVGLGLSLGPTLPGLPVYQALHRWVPLFGLIRNPEKFRLLVSLGAAVLAGHGVKALTERASGRAARAVAVALVVAVVITTAPWHGIAVTRLPETPIYAALRAEAGRVLYLPVWPGDSAWSALYLYHATRTRVPMLNGYSPFVPRRYGADVFEPLQGLNVGELGPAEQALLRRLAVTHIVLDQAAFPPQVSPLPPAFTRERLRASPALVLEQARDPLWVFRMRDTPAADQPPATSPVGVFFEAEALPRETGSLAQDDTASGARIVAGRPGADRPGFLTFGPYRLLPAGVYRATFRVRGAGLTIEVAAERGRRLIAQREVGPSAAWADVLLPFVLDHARPVEFRVRWNGTAEAAVDWVSVVFADRPEPEWLFEVEDLPHLLGERLDTAASGGRAGYADPVESRRIPLVSGPARLYPAGAYRLVLRARAEGPVSGPLLRLTVTEPAGRVLAARTVDAAELRSGAYREVSLDFRLPRPTVVEFPIGYLGGGGVFFDRLEVIPEAGWASGSGAGAREPARPAPPQR